MKTRQIFKQAFLKLDNWYRGMFWKLHVKGNEFTLKPRRWMHYLIMIIRIPINVAKLFFESLDILISPQVSQRTVTIDSNWEEKVPKSDHKKLKSEIKERLLS